jgi:hypothetical protein
MGLEEKPKRSKVIGSQDCTVISSELSGNRKSKMAGIYEFRKMFGGLERVDC